MISMIKLLLVVFTVTFFTTKSANSEPYETVKPYDEPKPYQPEKYESYEPYEPSYGTTVTGIGKSGVGIGSVLAAKKGLILAPFVLGAKAAVYSVPMATGAILGAPIGAVIGAKVGAVKGAAIAKSVVTGKLALAKAAIVGKAALAKSAVIAAKGAAKAIVMKPIAFAVGATAAAASAKASLVSKGMTIIHDKVEGVHHGIVNAGTQIKTTVSSLSNSLNLLQALLPLLASQNKGNDKGYSEGNTYSTQVYKKPSTVEATYTLDTPITGYQYGKANFVAARRKRSPQRSQVQSQDASVQRMNQLLTLVNQQKQGPCVQKVICELSVDPNVHGKEGVRFGFALLQYSSLNHPGTGPYKAASALGAKYKDARVCVTEKCKIPSNQIIRLGLALLGV